MKIQIEEKKVVLIEKTYHFMIKIDGDLYFIIVQTQTIGINGKETVVSKKRGITSLDCRKRLRTAQKKLIKRTIDTMF